MSQTRPPVEKGDIEELENLIKNSSTSRPFVQHILKTALKNAKEEFELVIAQQMKEDQIENDNKLQSMKSASKKETSPSISPAPAPSTSTHLFTPINKYAWDQSKTFVSVYISFPSDIVLSSENLSVEFGSRSVDLQLRNHNKTLRFFVPNLCFPIRVKDSSFRLKEAQSMVTIKLRKEEDGKEWSAFDDREELKKQRHQKLVEQGASTMELLQNMMKESDEQTQESLMEAYRTGQKKREENEEEEEAKRRRQGLA